MPENRKPLPGDADYKGGVTHTTVRINGKNKDVRIERDAYGNVVSTLISDKILGIF